MRRRSPATVLVGPSALLREGLTRILSQTEFRIVASVSHTQDIGWASLASFQPILLIISAGDDPNDTAGQIKFCKEQHPGARVAVVASHHCPGAMIAAFQAGANSYHAKIANFDVFTKALELVLLGETVFPPELSSFISDCKGKGELIPPVAEQLSGGDKPARPAVSNIPELSSREKCILRRIADGDSNKDIARKVGIAEATVKVHVKAILRKIRIHNRTQAAIWAVNNSAVLSLTDHSALATAPAQARPLLPAASTASLPLTRPMDRAAIQR